WIQSDGRECLNVKSPGVFVQGMQFMCNGIGDLAAISIADGGELELDGCRIQSATSVGLTSSNASLTTTGTTITASGGTALRVKGGKANLTQTTLSDSKLGASLSAGAAVELKSCALERDGAGDAQTGVIFINGPATSVTATDCQFTGNNGGVYVTSGGSFAAEKTSFKENAAGAKYIYGLILVEKASVVRLNGCAFERNRAGVAVSEGGTLEADQCAFSDNGLQSRQLIAESLPISVIGQHARATVRNSSFAHSTPYAIGVSNAGTATIDNIEVSGTKDTGLAVGDDKTPPAHVEVAHAHFHNNENGMAVFFGSIAKIDDSEFRENETSGLAAIKNAQVEVHNTRFLMNGNEGLLVYGQARAVASGCQFIGNARGAESGYAKRNAGGHASLTIEDSEVGGNRVFGLGALSANELIVRNVTFHGDDKVPIYKEKNAVVKMETPAGAQTEPDAHESPSPGASASATPNELPEATASPQPSTSPGKSSAPKKSGQRTRQRQRRPDDEAARILRNIFGPH
ncbi:MAG TPA: right-handed parallel beta-helix repeat-containing protein, partial [Chthoniobacterales bacterium]